MEIKLLKEGNKRLTAALYDERTRIKRGRKLMEWFIAKDEGNAFFFSPRMVKELQELEQARQERICNSKQKL